MDETISIPEVSVIMPAYNASDYIQESINSVIAQTFTNWELIIVDDGSTDKTSVIIENYCNQDERIKYYYQENGKQGKARNFGVSLANAKYIAFLDADDLWMPEKLEIQLQQIEEKNVDLVFSDSYKFYDDDSSDKSRKMNVSDITLKGNEALKLFLQANRIPILTVLVKKEKIILVETFSEKMVIQNAEDYHLWLKLIISGCVFYGSDEVLASYRIHSKSSTSNDKSASNQIPEVFFDLMKRNVGLKQILLKALKREYRKQYAGRIYSKSDLSILIDNNCRYIEKQNYSPFFKVFNFVFGTRITKKLLIHLLNA
jgi:teichuronic acid biosynthesis glycosyltransferase TuaG